MTAHTGIARLGRARREPAGALEQYRDDGPLAQALGVLGRLVAVPPFLLVGAGVAGLLALAALEGDGASDATLAAGIAWMVLLGGGSSGRPHTDRFAWSTPGLLRVGEYAGIVWIAANAGGAAPAAAFALLTALAFRHYDLVYRPRFQGVPVPAWLQVLAGGWDGRLIAVWLLLVAGALPAGLFVLAGILGATFVADCVMSWVRHSAAALSVYEDEEDEGQ
ncbi:MAG: hypothetical protein QOJ22_1337 [Thermoleophilaceae bacterium]|jgi:predicted outer membrane lipoprotein|nr:hypothetical protein [Thermoleophilaceae bacterium]